MAKKKAKKKARNLADLAVEGLTERGPQLLEVLARLAHTDPAPQKFKVGEVIQTPGGEMVVVDTPHGLALVPRS